ncbi:uncharacterized protein LOC119739223 [Patiria miniata]|uniref:Uncharacterized protein n=1 Tax=Patiria miniata TaxID=46514 RepID=A0A914B264_PATMI|nr:uncharacterized protein LOC119722599 [Patiria miniata]XP_038070003.1 uncharacterized protein LOC119739223 [Patiria miniata]
MGGCCCNNNDATEDDGEEKCIIADDEEQEPSSKGYGSVSTVEDKHELQYQEPPDTNRNVKQSPSTDELTQSAEPSSDEQSSTIDLHVSKSGISLQQTSEGQASETEVTSNLDEAVSDDMSQGDVDREIDELVAAAMAAKVVYPPSAAQEESSLCRSPKPSAGHEPSTISTQDLAASDQDEDSDQEATPSKGLSLIKKTQLSFKRAKARATSMVSMPSKSSSGEQIEKQRKSLQEKKTSRPDKKKFSMEERAMEGDVKKPLYSKKNSRESQTTGTASKVGTKAGKKKTGFIPGERMRSHYAKDRVGKFEVERDVREKMAAHKSASDPRKAALERGERLGQLDDTIQDMRDHSSSFAQVARQLRDEQRGRTSTFPW